MNIIDAWKKAKVGDFVKRKTASDWSNSPKEGGGGIIKGSQVNYGEYDKGKSVLVDHLSKINSDWVLADDWEVERKPMVWEGTVIWHRETNQGNPDIAVPYGYHGCENRAELMKFIGKRTRIKIEEIIE